MNSGAYFYIYKDFEGQWRWWFVSESKDVIAISQNGFDNLADCEESIFHLKTQSPNAFDFGCVNYNISKECEYPRDLCLM
ncbi:hypothetical protein P0Y67_19805 [Photobacterium sp. SP02]|uniref:hypothetical protein n=1 Tax=Photobacterium sp. SP02 TaxID=3032280 RepID=UPI0031451DA0